MLKSMILKVLVYSTIFYLEYSLSYNLNLVNFNKSMSSHSKVYNKYHLNTEWGKQVLNAYNNFANNKKIYKRPLIPKLIHQIWLGSKLPIPEYKLHLTWINKHPEWIYILWTDNEKNYKLGKLVNSIEELKLAISSSKNLKNKIFVFDVKNMNLKNQNIFNSSKNFGQKSDILRYEVLYNFGGLYVDTDFECLKSFNALHHTLEFYAGVASSLKKPQVFNGLIGSTVKNPILKTCINNLSLKGNKIVYNTGPYFFASQIYNSIKNWSHTYVLFPVTYFYSWPHYVKNIRERQQILKWIKPESFAIHHWHVSWKNLKSW